ncbi:MAG: DUF433 domain-containing protein [Chloroflexi bacterium]|nr:DUF433 domain-containing protein [Chloroflexota bacterium]
MKTVQKSLRVPQAVAQTIEEIAEASRRDFSSVTNEMLTEAIKVRRCPGILFADGPSGRQARVAGTGLDVWEIIATHKGMEQDPERLSRAYHWLSQAQLRAALGYYAAYPEEIERQIAVNEAWTPERLAEQHPTLLADRR